MTLKTRVRRWRDNLVVALMVAGMIGGVCLGVGLLYILIYGPIILLLKWLFHL